MFYYVLYCVLRSERYFYLHILEEFLDFSCFFSAVCRNRLFCFSVMLIDVCILFLWRGVFYDFIYIIVTVMLCFL
jgi:hypothetical protein